MRLPAFVDRLLARPEVVLVQRVLDAYGRAPGGLLANGLAFAALFATFPIVLLVFGVVGLIVSDPEAQNRLADALKALFPPLAGFIDEALARVTAGATIASLLGLIGVIWGVSQLYVTLDVAFSRIFADRRERDPVKRTIRGFLWVAILIGVVVGAILIGLVASAVATLFPDAPGATSIVRSVVGSWPFLFAMGVGVISLVYWTLPPARPHWRAIWLPAIIVGVVIVVLSQVFLLVAPLLVGAAAFAGSLATAFIALAWLSFTFQALLYGAAWVRVRDEARSPAAGATEPGSGLSGAAAPAEPGGGGE